MSISDERVVAAVQQAYDEYIEFLRGMQKHLRLRLGNINKAERAFIKKEGILLKVHFEIVYVPAGDILECDTLILDSFDQVFDVKNVSCDCCRENKTEDVMKNIVSQKIIIALRACFHYRHAWFNLLYLK